MSQEPNNIDAAIADLESWLVRISTAIETLKYFRSQGGALPGMPASVEVERVSERVSSNGDIAHDTFFQMTVADAAAKYLGMVKKTTRIPELSDALLKGGVKSSSKKFPDMLRIMIRRDPRFVNVNSEWGLREWYPGMRRGTKVAPDPSIEPKPSGVPIKKPKGEHKKEAFSPDSLRGRTLNLLNSKPNELFSAAKVTEALGADHKPSVAAALSGLLADHLIARPQKGQYQAQKRP